MNDKYQILKESILLQELFGIFGKKINDPVFGSLKKHGNIYYAEYYDIEIEIDGDPKKYYKSFEYFKQHKKDIYKKLIKKF